jgi:hypothetical protein
MKVATRAFIALLCIAFGVSSAHFQTLRPGDDPRNQAPTVGTGGTPGGPTGLFTIYDGDTLRKGEFTFSVAYSNYDRDPGNVDFTVIPLSFNIGLSDHLELFYSTEGYRGVKVNNPKNLSGFYLPNSQLYFSATQLCVPAAIILAPVRVSGSTSLTSFNPLYRPACNQPLVGFPFNGGVGPNFGLSGNRIAPPFTSVLGTPTGGGGNFGSASNFPGIGSVYGSILPGVVLTTRVIPANLTFKTLTVPDLFTNAPTYIADAPFINRLYGESAFGTMQAGAKIRFTGPHNPLGLGLVAFYRWYTDKADDARGFNQLQRGASPGGNFGDIGAVLFGSARLSKHWTGSVNIGYIRNSNPKSDAMGGAVLLDRPDETIIGFGVDYVPNKHWQIIGEGKTVFYTGGRTPNAFPNNPTEFLGGLRYYIRRWIGVSGWYRAHLNQQGDRFLGGVFGNFNPPAGFQQSTNPHGFGFQFFAGHRNVREFPKVNVAPNVESVTLSDTVVNLPCPAGTTSAAGCSDNHTISVATRATDPENDVLTYNYTVSGGRIVGTGANVSWDLSGVGAGTYTITTGVDDGCGVCGKTNTQTITVRQCLDCKTEVHCACPTLSVSGPTDVVRPGTPLTFTATSSGDVTYNWTVSAGTISSGQGTSSITVDTSGLAANSTINATVDISGSANLCADCPRTASSSGSIAALPQAQLVDTYGKLSNDDVKARIQGFYTSLNADPNAHGYIIIYGTPAQIRAARAQITKAISFQKFDPSRVTIVEGPPQGTDVQVKLYLVPAGAENPAP